ncbi:MAG: DUF433 domain-containing protein [Thermoflexales bacterium]|jgi:uncharacterized protein (DUF433 family)|nr:DUF433 domain-containing protein [Thermoflexales bacterium]
MQLEDYFEFLGSESCDPSSSQGIRIKGHRIYIEHVLRYYLSGYNPDEIAKEYPGLGLDKIYAAITYYLAHRAEVDKYMARIEEESEQAYQEWLARPPSPVRQRIRDLYTKQAQGQGI